MDPLESMWVSEAARGKGAPAPAPRQAVTRDPTLPCFPSPTEVALTEQLRELQEGGTERACALVSCALLPKDATVMEQYPLPLGAVVSPLGADKSAFVAVRDTCPLCADCGAAVTSFSAVNSGCQWICAFCDADNEADWRYGQMEPNWGEFPELHHAAIEWDEGPCDHLVSEGGDTFVVLVDLSMASDDLTAVARALCEAVKQMSGAPEARIALLGFDNAVHVFRLDCSADGISSSLCFPAIRPLNEAERDMLTRPEVRGQLIVPAEAAARSGAFQIAADALGNVSLFRNNVGLAARERGLAQALEVASFLANPQQRPYSRARVIFVLGGPPNLFPDGPAAARSPGAYWEALSRRLGGSIHSLEALLVSPQQCQVESFFPALFQAVAGSPTPVPFAPKNACPDFERAVTASLSQLLRPLGCAAVSFGVFAQRNIQITHVIGPLVGDGSSRGKLSFLTASSGTGRNDSLSVLFDQKLGSGSVTLLQVLCSYIDLRAMRLVKRVVTIPMVHTRDLDSFRAGISDSVTGALLAKRVAAGVNEMRRSGKTSLESVEQFVLAVDRTLTNATKQFEEQVTAKNLAALPFICYALRKSPVVVGGGDDQNYLVRQLVGRLNVADTLGVLCPKLFRADRADGGGELTIVSVPPEEVALLPHHVLGMDSFSHLFLWSGERTTAQDVEARNALVEHLLALAADRAPQPVLYSFRQGDSGARFVVHQLVPSHVDRPEELEAAFPALAALSPEERKLFLQSFGVTDELSFRQYCRQVFADARRFRDAKQN